MNLIFKIIPPTSYLKLSHFVNLERVKNMSKFERFTFNPIFIP